jgi:glyoxylase-like metal-dependent hydrolase (beta-lactamase superfamily II)
VLSLPVALWWGGTDSASGPSSDLRLYEFDCGRIEIDSPEAAGFGVKDDATDVRELFVPCYLIEHPGGRLLWDGGLPSAFAEVDGWQENEGWRFRLDRTLADQLADIGLTFDSLNLAAFSHMHFDHVGVANEIASATTLLIQRPEYDAAFGEEEVPGFDPSLYDRLQDRDWVFLEGDHDVFGDGRVRILSLPGHTPGHQALFVDLTKEGPVVLSGDLYHFRVSRKERIVPVWNTDGEATLSSMDRLEAFVQETGATLWIEHDLARYLESVPEAGYHD